LVSLGTTNIAEAYIDKAVAKFVGREQAISGFDQPVEAGPQE
jgi:hypothetical protein